MMKPADRIKTLLVGLVVAAAFCGAMFALNVYTGPLIEANNAGAEFGPLLAVMPEGAGFDGDALIYSASQGTGAGLSGVPESVTAIYREKSGMGYAVKVTAVSNYSKEPMEITLGVDAQGMIVRAQVDAYHDTESYDFRVKDPSYLDSYVGKDSALADVGTVSGSTFSSSAFKTGIEEAMSALVANQLIAEGVKGEEQLLLELLPSVFPGIASESILKAEEIAPSGNIVLAYQAENGSGFAYIFQDGERMALAVVNASGLCKIYDAQGDEITSSCGDLAEEAKAHAAGGQADQNEAAQAKFAKMVEGAGEMEALELPTFSTIVAGASFPVGDQTYFGFYSRSYGYKDMDIYVVIDQQGAIVNLDAKRVFFDEEYFPVAKQVDAAAYQEGFTGLTGQSWTEDTAMISGATMTSNAVAQSVADAFEAYEAVTNGGVDQ